MRNVEIGESISLSSFLQMDLGLSIHLRDLAYMLGVEEEKLPEPEILVGEFGGLNSQLARVFGKYPYFYHTPYFPLLPPEKQQEEMEMLLSMDAREANSRYGKLIFSLTPDRRINRERLSTLQYALYLDGLYRTFVNYGRISAVGEEAHLHFRRFLNPHEHILDQDGFDLIFPRQRERAGQVRIAIDIIPRHLMREVIEYRTSPLYL